VPRKDAKWVGHLLAQLSTDQLRSAFRAAGYVDQDIEAPASPCSVARPLVIGIDREHLRGALDAPFEVRQEALVRKIEWM
jgi:hypothetical protein